MARRSILGALACRHKVTGRPKRAQLRRSQRPRSQNRRALFEHLEGRDLLASDFQNPFVPLDVSGDGVVSPLDVLQIINELNTNGPGPLPQGGNVEGFFDTNGDCNISAIDALQVVNALNDDRTGPQAVAMLQNDTGPGGTTNADLITSDPAIVGMVTDLTGVASLQIEIDGGPRIAIAVNQDGSFSFTPDLEDGPHTIRLIGVDGVANEGVTEFSFTLDTTPPVLDNFGLTAATDTGISNSDNVTKLSDVTLAGDTESGATVTLSQGGQVIGTEVAGNSVSFSVTGLTSGSHSFQATPEDVAGNDGLPVDVEILVDTVAPVLSIQSPTGGATVSPGSHLVGTLNDDADQGLVTYQFANGPSNQIAVSGSGQIDRELIFTGVNPGAQPLLVQASDQAGNEALVNIAVNVEFDGGPLTLVAVEPANGDSGVGVGVRPKITFNRPVNPATLSPASFFAEAGGTILDATIVPSASADFAWLFPTDGLPGSSTVTVTVDGDLITDFAGQLLDADADGTPGGIGTFTFTTGSTTPVAGTSLTGIVLDPGPDLLPNTADDQPLDGVEVSLLGLASDFTTTDALGRFTFNSVPTGTVQIRFDGSTAGAPAGVYFPELVLEAHIEPAQVNFVMAGMEEVFLPRLDTEILRTVPASTGALLVASDAGGPDLTPEQRQLLSIQVPADSLVSPSGAFRNSAMIGISTVPPEVVANMLPPGVLQDTFSITVQALEIAHFAAPAPVTFPNVFNEPPGTQLNVLGFSRTTGKLMIEGTATVSSDGTFVATDPGNGVTSPGWHGLTPQGSLVIGDNGANNSNGTGRPPSGAATTGSHFIAVETPDLPGSPVLRRVTSSNGAFEFFLPPETNYRVVRFDPASGLVSHFAGVTGVSGGQTTVPAPAFEVSTAPDNDNDGLPEDAEFAIGSSDNEPDSNLDGINDGDAIAAGLNPLGDAAALIGTVGAVGLNGSALEVETGVSLLDPNQALAFVATGASGLSIVDVSDPLAPVILSVVDLAGDNRDVAYLASEGLLLVAGGDAGLHLVDVSDPARPILDETIAIGGPATRVASLGSAPVVARGSEVVRVDIVAGEVVASLGLGGPPISDILISGNTAFIAQGATNTPGTVTALDVTGNSLSVLHSTNIDRGVDSLAINGSTLMVGSTFLGGFSTIDVANPSNLTQVGGFGTDQRIRATATAVPNANSVLLGGIVPDLAATTEIQLFRTLNPLNTNSFVTASMTAGSAQGLAQAGRTTVAATGSSGLEFLNFFALDTNGFAPTIEIDTRHDLDVTLAGVQAIVGSTIPIQVVVADDIQVARVDLFADGELIARDLNAPFDLDAIIPASMSGTVTLTAQAVDTGGNVGVSNALPIDVASVIDADPPQITSLLLGENDFVQANREFSFDTRFSESISLDTLSGDNFFFEDSQGTPIFPTEVTPRRGGRLVSLSFSGIPAGDYTFVIKADQVTDLAGNPLGAARLERQVQAIVADAVFSNPEGGDYNLPSNWQSGNVPTSTDSVLLPFDNVPVRLPSGGQISVVQLFNRSELIAQGATTLRGDLLNGPTGVLRVVGDGLFGDAVATADGNISNRGRIQLEASPSVSGGLLGDDATLVISNGTLTNEASGVIASLRPGVVGDLNARRIRGDVVNLGTVSIGQDLDFDQVGTTLTNRATIDAATGDLNLRASGLVHENGAINGPGRVALSSEATLSLNSDLTVPDALTLVLASDSVIDGAGGLTIAPGGLVDLRDAAIEVNVTNAGNLLARTDDALLSGTLTNEPGGVLEVRGDDSFNDAILTATAGITNRGTIELDAEPGLEGDSTGDDATLVINNSTLNNEAGGTLATVASAIAGANDTRRIHANVENRGTLVIGETLLFDRANATLTNHGAIEVSSGELILSDTTLLHEAGTIAGPGNIDLENSATLRLNGDLAVPDTLTVFVRAGSRINGPATLLIHSGGLVDLRDAVIDAAVSNAGRVLARTSAAVVNGAFVNESGGHLEIRGDDTFQDAKLTVNTDLTNRGTIELTAVPAFVGDATGDDVTLEVNNGSLTNDTAGVIVATPSLLAGRDDLRQLHANVLNHGTLQIDQTLDFNSDAKQLTNHGTIDINSGSLNLEQTTFVHEAGAVNGPGSLDLIDAATVTLNAELTVPDGLTVVARGGSAINGTADLTIASGGLLNLQDASVDVSVTNHGGLLARTANAVLNSPLTNAVGGLLEVRGDSDLGDARLSVNAAVTNLGTIELEAFPAADADPNGDDATLIVNDAVLSNAAGGTIASLAPATLGSTNLRRLLADVENQGTLLIDQTLDFNLLGTALTNEATIQINAGDLKLQETNLFYEGGTVSGPGRLNLADDAQLILNAALVVPDTLTVVVAGGSRVGGTSPLTVAAGGVLDLQDGTVEAPVTNLGHLLAQTGSAVLSGALVNEAGGLLEVRGAGSLDAVLTLAADATNRGTIELTAVPDVEGDPDGDDATLVIADAVLTNEAGGVINSVAPLILGATDARRIRGDVDSAGAINVDQTLTLDQLDKRLTNSGTIAINTGEVRFINSILGQAGGTVIGPGDMDFDISAGLDLGTDFTIPDTVAVVLQNSSSVNGVGTLLVDPGGLLDLRDATINTPVNNQGRFIARTDTALANGEITNEVGGLLEIRGDDTHRDAIFTVNAAVTNRGTIELEAEPGFPGDTTGDDATLKVAGAALVNEIGATITSLPPAATNGDLNARLLQGNVNNAGTISVTQSLTLNEPETTLTQSGTIELIGGQLNFFDTTFLQDGGTVIGAGGVDLENNATLTLDDNLTINEDVSLFVRVNSKVDGTGLLFIAPQGTLDLRDAIIHVPVSNSGTFNVRTSQAVVNTTLMNEQTGLIELLADATFGDVRLNVNGDFVNRGRLDLEADPGIGGGSTGDDVALFVNNGMLVNEPTGRVFSQRSATFGADNRRTFTAVLDNQGTITATADLLLDAEMAAHTNSGTIEGGTVTIVGMDTTFESSGDIMIPIGRTLTTPTFSQTAGTTIVDGAMFSTDGIELSGGTLGGRGFIFADVTNSGGTVAPGMGPESTGRLLVSGNYVQEADGTLDIEIGGAGFFQFDLLQVFGDVTIEGTLNLSLVNDYEPTTVEAFRSLTSFQLTGTFEFVNGTAAPNDLVLVPVYNFADVTITVAQPLRLAGEVGSGGNEIGLDDVGLLREAAVSLWAAAGISAESASLLSQVEFRIVDLEGDLLGLAYDNVVLLDRDAAGMGWFVDESPATSDDLAADRIDLLTVLAHELGHTLGLADNLDPLAADIMAAQLAAGQRRSPSTSDVDRVMAGFASE